MKAVILAGGLGKRLDPLSKIIPKSLLPVGERSVLEIQVASLKEHGVREIFIATYHRADYIQAFLGDGSKYGVRLHYSVEAKPLGTCGPLTLLRDRLDKPFLMINGDILTTLDFARLYDEASKNDAKLTVVTKIITAPFEFGQVVSSGPYITEIREKPEIPFEILAGIYIIDPELLQMIPDATFYGMDDLINDMFERGMPVARYLTDSYWLDIGQPGEFEAAQRDYEVHFKKSGRRRR